MTLTASFAAGTPGDDEWLRQQEADRRYAFDQQLAYEARRSALKRERQAELAAEAAKVRARQCPDCFLVRTPAGTCDCTEG
ncbi:hypothetical protein AB0M39_40975 [Streptomyces sp. NPDC051907]|uniref:hypothetical protein n=1 Tax=Streptomyces sp. NPDC051907 TaxID=3155284 RepID=UPI00344965A1